MQTIIRTLFLLSISASTLYAQEFQGVATYKTKNKIEIELDSTMTDVMQEQIMAMLQKQSEKTFTLKFSETDINKHYQKLSVIRQIVDNSNLSHQEVVYVTKSIDSLQAEILTQVKSQLVQDVPTKK